MSEYHLNTDDNDVVLVDHPAVAAPEQQLHHPLQDAYEAPSPLPPLSSSPQPSPLPREEEVTIPEVPPEVAIPTAVTPPPPPLPDLDTIPPPYLHQQRTSTTSIPPSTTTSPPLPDLEENVAIFRMGGPDEKAVSMLYNEHALRKRRFQIPMVLMPFLFALRQRLPYIIPAATVSLFTLIAVLTAREDDELVRVAMIGNSMMYYNDLPRLLETMARGHLVQNSCLHGNADFSSHLWYGNGMYDKWKTGQARIWDVKEYEIYDYGACTPQQLLFGTDERLVERRRKQRQRKLDQTSNQTYFPTSTNNVTAAPSFYMDDDAYQLTDDDNWEYNLDNDRTNPCLMSEAYNDYMEALYEVNGPPHWDYVLINDNTRNPCCTEQRAEGLDLLKTVYLPWIKQIHATPIFLSTYGYWAAGRDMSGLTDIPTFTSLTYEGYREYANAAEQFLPAELKPRIAPVGLAFLMVWEESPKIWVDLIHNDQIHPSPSGTFLEACVVYATIFGRLPSPGLLFGEQGLARLWSNARRMTPTEHQYKPYPTKSTAEYLYNVAHRIVLQGKMPKSLTLYQYNESAYFTPDDGKYENQVDQSYVVRDGNGHQ